MAQLSSYVQELKLAAGTSVTDLPNGCQFIYKRHCFNGSNAHGNYQFDCCYAFIVPQDAVRATFETFGGGGGGGVSCCCMNGAPGGSGAYARKTIPVTAGWCYDLCLGQQSCCHNGRNGFRGCRSKISGCNVDMCAAGGKPGCSFCFPGCGCYVTGYCCCRAWNCNCCQNDNTAEASGGDFMVCGVRGWMQHRRCGGHCCHKIHFPYPGGLFNKCGGTVGVQGGDRGFSTFVNCSAADYTGFARLHSQYVPGQGGATYVRWSGGCHCGSYGTPGMIRITWYTS